MFRNCFKELFKVLNYNYEVYVKYNNACKNFASLYNYYLNKNNSSKNQFLIHRNDIVRLINKFVLPNQ